MTLPTFAITRLDAAHAVIVPVPTSFVSEVNGTLSNFGTASDGFDSILSDALLSVDADHAAVLTLSQTLGPADFVPGLFADTYHTPLGIDLAAFQATGDTLAGQVDAATTVPTGGGAPVPVPPPVGGAGAGSGGGVGPIQIPTPPPLSDPGIDIGTIPGVGGCSFIDDPNCP